MAVSDALFMLTAFFSALIDSSWSDFRVMPTPLYPESSILSDNHFTEAGVGPLASTDMVQSPNFWLS